MRIRRPAAVETSRPSPARQASSSEALSPRQHRRVEDSVGYARCVAVAYARKHRFDVDEAIGNAFSALVLAALEWDEARSAWEPFLRTRIVYAIVDAERKTRGRRFREPPASIDADDFGEIADTAASAEQLAIAREQLAEAKRKADASPAQRRRERAQERRRPTAASLEVLSGLASTGLSPDAYAAHTQRSAETIKSHLKAVRAAYALKGKNILHVYAHALRLGHVRLPDADAPLPPPEPEVVAHGADPVPDPDASSASPQWKQVLGMAEALADPRTDELRDCPDWMREAFVAQHPNGGGAVEVVPLRLYHAMCGELIARRPEE